MSQSGTLQHRSNNSQQGTLQHQPERKEEEAEGCCGEASWQREDISDHKFDYVSPLVILL
jgi:hypothetical protein